MSGQNPTNEECEKMIAEAIELGSHMLMFNDIIPIVEKYWRDYENYQENLRQACSAFDKSDLGIINFDDLAKMLMTYGDKLDDDDIYLMRKAFNVADDKLIVDDLIKTLSPFDTKDKKAKKPTGKKNAKK